MSLLGIWRFDAQRTGCFRQSRGGKPKQLMWKRFIKRGIGGSPIVVGDRLFISSDAGLHLLTLSNLSIRYWKPKEPRYTVAFPNIMGPTIAGNKLLAIHDEDGGYSSLRAYETNSHTLIWQTRMFGAANSPLATGDKVIASSLNEVAAYSVANGRKLWRFYLPMSFGVSPATLANDCIIVYTSHDGVFAIERNSGRLRWHRPLENGLACPCAGSDRVFIVTHETNRSSAAYALRLSDGHILWRRSIDGGDASPAFDGSYVYVAGLGGKLTCLRATTGQICWRFQMEAGTSCAPSIGGNTIYIGDNKGVLYGLDTRTGRLLWRYTTQRAVVGTPWVLRDRVLFASTDGYIYCFEI